MAKKLFLFFSYLILLAIPFAVYAINDIPTIITNIMNEIVWPIFGGAAIIMTLWAGYLFLSANGNPAKVSASRKAMLLVVVGVALALAASGLVGIIKGLFGL